MHTKCEPRSWLCCFLGYGVEQKGCRCYDLVSHHLRISCHVVFWEHQLFHEAGKFSIVPFPPFTTLLETPLSPTPIDDVLPKPLSLEQHSFETLDAALLVSSGYVPSEDLGYILPPNLRLFTQVRSFSSHL
jgi:hypothetical protein